MKKLICPVLLGSFLAAIILSVSSCSSWKKTALSYEEQYDSLKNEYSEKLEKMEYYESLPNSIKKLEDSNVSLQEKIEALEQENKLLSENLRQVGVRQDQIKELLDSASEKIGVAKTNLTK